MEQEGTYYEKLWFIQTERGECDMSSIYGLYIALRKREEKPSFNLFIGTYRVGFD